MGNAHQHLHFLDDVYRFWFLDPATGEERQSRQWFQEGKALDGGVGAFLPRWRALLRDLEAEPGLASRLAWGDAGEATKRRFVALVVVLDQFPRHLFRGTSAAYAYDERALEVAFRGIDHWTHYRSHLEELLNPGGTHLLFLLLPFQHTESLEAQEWGLETLQRLLRLSQAKDFGRRHPGCREALQNMATHQKGHLWVLQRFGRFPKRSGTLGLSEEERRYVQEDNGLPY